MDNIQELLKDATDYLSSGNVKDAYFSYISALDVVTRELHSIKFVNNVVTSKPASLSSIFALSRTCLSYAEDIIVKHQTPPIPRRNPNLNIAIFPPTPQQEEHPHNLSPHRAPPIPPKPMRRSFNKVGEDGSSSNYPKNEPPALKPPLPPKPVRTASMKKYLVDIEVSGSGRDAHVVSGEGEDDDADSSDSDDDDDDDYVERNGSYLRRSESSLDVAIPQTSLRRRSSSPGRVVSTSRRRPTLTGSITGSITDSPTDEESPYSSHLTSPTTPASFYGAIAVPVSMPNLFEQRPKMISVIPEGAVDPNNLVPAIVSTESENAQSPSSPSSSQYSYHVPEIPASPLITQHTQFEQKIQTLETKLAEYRAISKKREAGNSESDSDELSRTELPDEEINEAIEKYGTTVAGLKQTITRSRKLVYKAAADPDILEFAPHMIAYQLTLIESAIFLEIDPTTLLTHSAKSPDSKITASTDFFNYLTRVVERSILLPLEASSRAQIINHWVKVAVKLHELHNFQTLKAILAALGTPPIKRLKRTWACIPKKSMVRLEALCDMMSETRNYGKYRETIQREGFLRKPTIPFLGTFIMDATYLLAAVKSAGSSNSVSSSNNNINHVPTTPRSTTSMITLTSPGAMQSLQEDPRVQELLQTMMRYQHGPKYQPIPPVTYIKASTKHFRTASISAALHRSSGYKYNHRSEEEEESIEEKQQLITHYLLTRVWIPEKSVDELSLMREPHKYKNGCRASGTASWSGTPNSIISNASSAYRGSTGSTVGGSGTSTGENASTSSGIGRASSTSGSGDSRPHSLEEGVDAAPTASITSKLDRAGPISDKEVCNVKEKEKEKRNITEKVGNFFFGSRSSMDKARDEKEKEEKNKFSECEKEKDNAETICKVELSRIHAEPTIIMPTPISSNKRTSWRTMRVMFGSYEATETPKSPTAMMRAASHSRSSSSIELVPKSPTATFMKAHGRTTSANSPGAKPFTYAPGISTRRSLEEPRSATPPPLLPKPAALMQRSASASSSSSMGSSASAPGTRNSVGNSNPILIGNMDGIEDFRMALAKKVANEVTAGGGSLERNRQ